MSKKCDICSRNIGIFNGYKIKDGIICPYCTTICSSYKTESIDNMRRYWQINHERFTAFTETFNLKDLMSEIISIDDNNKLFMIGKLKNKNVEPIVYSFKEVVSYNNEMIGEKIVAKKKGGISRAIVGGVLAGPVGAFIGSETAKEEIKTSGGIPILKVNFAMESGNFVKIISFPPIGFINFLDKCILENNNKIKGNCDNAIDEIKRYKELLDNGAITEDEFQKLKMKLLNL